MIDEKWPADKIIRMPIGKLTPYARNARTHSDAQVAQIAASMREWGWTNPVLIDENGGIIAGHGRVMAARKLGLADVPCMVATGWTEAQKRAYVLADNKLALNAGWDDALLRLELGELDADGFDIGLIGFDDDELAGLLADKTEGLTDPDDVPEPLIPKTKQGDIWELGRHRLLCGSSISEGKQFVSAINPDLVLFDPPYDDPECWSVPVLSDKAIVFTDYKHIAEAMAICLGYPVIYHFVWDTVISWYTANRPLCRHRSAFYCAKTPGWDDEASTIVDGKSRKSVTKKSAAFAGKYIYEPLDGGRVRVTTVYQHSKTQDEAGNGKPVEWVRALLLGAQAKEVYDPFAGTGTTIIAAPDGCRVHAVEISPAKVDMIVDRWEQATGLKASLA